MLAAAVVAGGGGGGGGNYVRDGLVMYLDGLDKGGTQGYWKDIVNPSIFSFVIDSNATVEPNAVLMLGTGGLVSNTGIIVDSTNATIEVCGQLVTANSNYGFIYNGGRSDAATWGDDLALFWRKWGTTIGFGYRRLRGTNNDNVITFANSLDTVLAPFTASIKQGSGYLNGVNSLTYNSEGWSDYRPFSIGSAAGTNVYASNIRIYSIRIYSRKLTESEILSNQREDSNRFNLGLTIPTT